MNRTPLDAALLDVQGDGALDVALVDTDATLVVSDGLTGMPVLSPFAALKDTWSVATPRPLQPPRCG